MPATEITTLRSSAEFAATFKVSVAGPVPEFEVVIQAGSPRTDQAQLAPVWIETDKLPPPAGDWNVVGERTNEQAALGVPDPLTGIRNGDPGALAVTKT